MKKISSGSTEFYIGSHLLQANFVVELCKKLGNKIAVITDETLKNLYGIDLSQKLDAQLFTIPSGEKCKTRKVKEQIENALLKANYGRDTVLIALGGGATTDLVGFIASTYLRGIPLILLPTSLLAMIDASIGGKTAINTPQGKNLIGTFYPPKIVICDSQTLQTLPEKEKLNGLAEILKIGLTSDSSIWNFQGEDNELILKAIKKKIEIIEQDPFEKGVRRVLNFGHTIGHALETATHYTMAHGQAVWLGCIAESYLSHILGYLSLSDFHKILKQPLLSAFKWPSCHLKQISKALLFDKKKELGKIRFVLIDQIGHTVPFEGAYCSPVDPEALAATLSWMKDHYG